MNMLADGIERIDGNTALLKKHTSVSCELKRAVCNLHGNFHKVVAKCDHLLHIEMESDAIKSKNGSTNSRKGLNMEVGSHLHYACCSSCSGSLQDKTGKTLDQFKRDQILLLYDNLSDIIIHGSYVLDDFQPGKGDLDYMVITNENLDYSMNTRLFELVLTKVDSF